MRKPSIKRARNLSAEKTLSLALPEKDNLREVLHHIHTNGSLLEVTDGSRLHFAPNSAPCECKICQDEGQHFPDTKPFYVKEKHAKMTIEVDALRIAVYRAGLFAPSSDSITLTITKSYVNVMGCSQELGSSTTTVPSEFEYEAAHKENFENAFTIALNWKYLIHALDHAAPQGGTVTLEFANPVAPVLITGSIKNQGALVMPMRKDGDYKHPSSEPIEALYPVKIGKPVECETSHEYEAYKARAFYAVGPHTAMGYVPDSHKAVLFVRSEPAPAAVQSDTMAIVGSNYKHDQIILLVGAQPTQEEPQQPVTKSERMTALNIARAEIKRTTTGKAQAEALEALYKAFGDAQRKTPRPTATITEKTKAAAHVMNQIITKRRIEHNITGSLTNKPAPVAIPQDHIYIQ